ncbi:MAG: hypothetical protein ACI4BH_05480 [Muribaculaceae bacterium]
MSKEDNFLKACQENIGEWTCALHTSRSNQPAAIFREIKKRGYEFEEHTPGRWAKIKFCPICGQDTSHYKLLNPNPTLSSHERLNIDKKTRQRILNIFEYRDAFTGATISSTPEIDHKIPWTRLDSDIDAKMLNDDEIKEHFQLLTREHNLLKCRACDHCKLSNERLPLFGIRFWYDGNEHYEGICNGCGWFDGAVWREKLNDLLMKE